MSPAIPRTALWSPLVLCVVVGTAVAQPVWHLSAKPTLEIGDEAHVETQFNGITGLLRMPKGEIVVANGQSQELRVFSATGRYIRTLSRKGKGPGEVNSLARLWRSGDTIIVFDGGLGGAYLHWYTTEGFLRRQSLRVPGFSRWGAGPFGRFSSGRFAIRPAASAIQELPNKPIYDDTTTLGVLTPGETPSVIVIGDFVSGQLLTFASPFDKTRRAGWPFPYGRRGVFEVSGNRLWVGDTDGDVVQLWDDQARRSGSIRIPIGERPLNVGTIRRLQAQLFAAPARNPFEQASRAALRSAPYPRHAPRFSSFIPGTDGEMWIRQYTEDPEAPREYLVLDRAGKSIGQVTAPASITLWEIGRAYVLAVRTDEDGVEHVEMYALSRPR